MVIIGGWAHRLYRIYPSAQQGAFVPLMTLDTDVALPARLQVTGQDVRERLVANGFEEERLGQDKPPATHYRLGDSKTGFYAEFLTPLLGAEHSSFEMDGCDGQANHRLPCFQASPPLVEVDTCIWSPAMKSSYSV